MRKIASIIVAFVFVLGILLMVVPLKVQAGIGTNPSISGGSWTAGTEIDVSQAALTAPAWLQLLSTGDKLTAPGKICHSLRGGQYGWVGEIRELINGKWVRLATTDGWVPNLEGSYLACAQAPAAGVYALFGYYVAPVVKESPFDCSTVVWSSKVGNHLMVGTDVSNNVFFGGGISGVTDGTTITYLVTASSYPLYIGTTGTFTTGASGNVNFYPPSMTGNEITSMTVKFTESEHGCSETNDGTFRSE
jgi:hypothetical protein